ncbi:IS66 family insertion sequence element accessory protein TnpB [Facilibium subflavum]|uniref:IS66 family insertion sequence element accessory protein TnpB n=1 Tax=Facilibium subflavum TaxID=2219058 RepID=UPI000E65D8F1|nr:IS66 family insertion sequence element accessory protein TnpB [Facilibium subflavum]
MLTPAHEIYLANFPVDMRKSIDGLSALVLSQFGCAPTQKGSYFVFCNKARNRMKVLYFDKNGFALWMKRLEKDRFKLRYQNGQIVALDADQFQWLLSGLDYANMVGRKALNYSCFY